MTSKELDEKLEQLATLQLATRDAAFDLLPNPPSAAERNAFDLASCKVNSCSSFSSSSLEVMDLRIPVSFSFDFM